MGNILVWVFFDSIRTIELKVSEIGFKLCVIVHLGQVAEEDLPLPAGDHRAAFNPRLLQAALPGSPLPLLDRPLADLQAQRLPHIPGEPGREGAPQADDPLRGADSGRLQRGSRVL